MAKSLYHYQGMALHYLSEDSDYAVYYKIPLPGGNTRDYHTPYRVYKLTPSFGDHGWTLRHKLVSKYADLYSAVRCVRVLQGYST